MSQDQTTVAPPPDVLLRVARSLRIQAAACVEFWRGSDCQTAREEREEADERLAVAVWLESQAECRTQQPERQRR